MTPEQESSCHKIIHTAAAGAGAGNLIPVPGTGIAADLIAMTGMTMSLAAVFGGDLGTEAAKGMAWAAMKNAALRQPIKTIGKEVAKFIPFLGSAVGSGVSVVLIEAAGWAIAKDLDRKYGGSRRE